MGTAKYAPRAKTRAMVRWGEVVLGSEGGTGVAEPDARLGPELLPIDWRKTLREETRRFQELAMGIIPVKPGDSPTRVANGNGSHGLPRYGAWLRCDPPRGNAWPRPAVP